MQRLVCKMSPTADCDQVLSALNAYRRDEAERHENFEYTVNFDQVSRDGETDGSFFFKAKKDDGVAKLRLTRDSGMLFVVHLSEGE
jgi:hypothetical protein